MSVVAEVTLRRADGREVTRRSREPDRGGSENEAFERAARLFKALSSPTRLAVVVELGSGPRCVHELSTALSAGGRRVSQPLLSQHLKVLRDVGLVSTARRATEVTYRLIDDHVARIVRDSIRHSEIDYAHDGRRASSNAGHWDDH